tara:strand:- start:213 stop:1238 length:1026 start_codon:yes stop_codon:yes gene_type:complete
MAIAASGTVSAADIRTEYGLSGEVSFADLYRGGSYVRAKAANNNGTNLAASVPTSGTLTFDNFRGTAKGFKYTFTSGATNQNASTLFGDDYAVNYPKEIVINAGVELGATSTSEEALEIPSGSAGTITVINNGTLSGAGGAAGQSGGDAFEAGVACTLVNNGIIRAGGGGGGTGGQGSYTSSSTSGDTGGFPWSGTRWRTYYFNSNLQIYWNYSHIGAFSGQGNLTSKTVGNATYYRRGYMWTDANNENYYQVRRTLYSTVYTSGGSGGVGQGYNQSATSGSGGGTNAGSGGSGASFGQTGNGGVNGNYTNGVGGGASGKYIRGISFVTYTNNGSNLGGTA